jgi:hypothetical protein
LSSSKSATRKNAAHLQHRGHRVLVAGGEAFGYVGDGAGVEGDVLAGATVAPGGRTHQLPVAVYERQRDAVDLQLTKELGTRADLAGEPRRPRRQFVGVEHVVQRQHPFQVIGGGELGGETRTTDELGRRVGGAQFRIALLKGGEVAEQLVEFPVGDDGRVLDVVAELVAADLVGQRLPLASHVGGNRVGLGIRRG